MTRVLAALAIIVAVLSGVAATAWADGGCDIDLGCGNGDVVTSDDSADALIGSGAQILPRSYDAKGISRKGASECADCEWRFVTVCINSNRDGDVCQGASSGCPTDEFRMVVFMRHAADLAWSDVGRVCLGGVHQPVSVADAGERVRDRFVDLLPPPKPSYQPAGGALTNLPTIFASGQTEGVRADDFVLFDLPVHVLASPSWSWDFGDGATLDTTKAGGRYPDRSVSHTYVRAGTFQVQVASRWTGTYTIDGLGPFEVTGGPVTQSAELDVEVGQGAGQLVAP